MEVNKDLLDRALAVAREFEEGIIALPAEIPDFRGFYLAETKDDSIAAISGCVSDRKISYKIGNKKVN